MYSCLLTSGLVPLPDLCSLPIQSCLPITVIPSVPATALSALLEQEAQQQVNSDAWIPKSLLWPVSLISSLHTYKHHCSLVQSCVPELTATLRKLSHPLKSREHSQRRRSSSE